MMFPNFRVPKHHYVIPEFTHEAGVVINFCLHFPLANTRNIIFVPQDTLDGKRLAYNILHINLLQRVDLF